MDRDILGNGHDYDSHTSPDPRDAEIERLTRERDNAQANAERWRYCWETARDMSALALECLADAMGVSRGGDMIDAAKRLHAQLADRDARLTRIYGPADRVCLVCRCRPCVEDCPLHGWTP